MSWIFPSVDRSNYRDRGYSLPMVGAFGRIASVKTTNITPE